MQETIRMRAVLKEIFNLIKNADDKLPKIFPESSEYRKGYENSVRHFGDSILKIAKEKGINPVLVFHFADNIPACKMSESVGGKLVEERFHEKHGRFIRKYTFDTSKLD